MELVTGETLEQFIAKQGPLDPVLALDINSAGHLGAGGGKSSRSGPSRYQAGQSDP